MSKKKLDTNAAKAFGIFGILALAFFLLSEPGSNAGVINKPDLYYGEIWNFTGNESAWVFDFPEGVGIYHNFTGLQAGNLRGFKFLTNGGTLTDIEAEVAGTYLLNLHFSFSSTGKGLYGVIITKNHVTTGDRDCYGRRDITSPNSVGSLSITCLKEIAVGDTLSIQIEPELAPVKPILIHTTNMNAVRIGGFSTQ